MGNPFKLEIFYPDGDPENMWIATMPTRTGKVFYLSRDFWAAGANDYKRDLGRPGVYVLLGNDEDNDSDEEIIYIGEAENLYTRIENHRKNGDKDFYHSVVCVTETGDLTKTHFKWMESDLIERAKDIKRCNLKNGNEPKKPRMAASDTVVTEQFLHAILPIFQMAKIQAFADPKTFVSRTASDKNSIKKRKRAKLDREEIHEIREAVLTTFQNKENVTLLQLSPSRFYDETKTILVCCIISKYHGNEKEWDYEFYTDEKRVDFLKEGKHGYFVFGMSGQSKAIAITVDKLASKSANGEIRQWSLVSEEKGSFELKLMGGKTLDLAPYLFDIT